MKAEKNERKKYDSYERSSIIEQMSALNALTEARDFGTGQKYYTVEIHIMSYIADHPGITVTELATAWNRTTGAVCQIIKKLEAKGLIYKEKANGNLKNIYLYVTEKGETLHKAHKKYDNQTYLSFYKKLQKHYSEEKIQELFEMMEKWIELIIES